MKKFVNGIMNQLLENNQQLSTLRTVTKKDFEKTEELKQQMAQCVRLLTTALEERREALEFAYMKDQENSLLKAQLSEERRKNIKLMKVVLEAKGKKTQAEPSFDRDKVQSIITALGKLARDPVLRYSRPIQTMASSLRRAPRSQRIEDYAELKSTLQHQLILLKLPESKELDAFLTQVKNLLALI